MRKLRIVCTALLFVQSFVVAAPMPSDINLTEWVDAETGHKIVSIASEPYSMLPYFSVNSVSSDKRYLAYTAPGGIGLIDLKDFSSRIVVPRNGTEFRFVEMGRNTNRLYYEIKHTGEKDVSFQSFDIKTKATTKHSLLSRGFHVTSINTDETLGVGLYDSEGINEPRKNFAGKGERLSGRFEQKIPMSLFTLNLQTAAINEIYKSTDWLSHPQFSPSNPSLIMYSLEGPWHLVDRIWTIYSDGTKKTLIHKRTLEMEITGHEFWSKDGNHIFYDWQYPKGKEFFLASYAVNTGERSASPISPDQWSIHFNST